jgi:hypothetical protein
MGLVSELLPKLASTTRLIAWSGRPHPLCARAVA